MYKLGIITTQTQPWAGSEDLWSSFAIEALKEGHLIHLAVCETWQGTPRLNLLQNLGVSVKYWRKPNTRMQRLFGRIRREIKYLSLLKYRPIWDKMMPPGMDLLIVNQGGLFDACWTENLGQWVTRQKRDYALLIRSARSGGGVLDHHRQETRRYFKGARLVVAAAAENLLDAQIQLACSLPNTMVLHSPIRNASQCALPWPHGTEAAFGCVARLDAGEKGLDLLLQVLAQPQWAPRNFTLTFAGDGPDRIYLQELSTHLGLAHKVRFCGFVDNINQVWAVNQLHVLPSRSEGMPQSLLESMMAGRPAVVTAVGGMADWVEDGISGFVARSATVGCLRDAMEQAWASRDSWKDMGAAARLRCLALYDPNPGRTLLQTIIKTMENPQPCKSPVTF